MSSIDKSVLVTGSSRGIGRAIALRLARDGYRVVVHCRSRRAEADAVAAEIAAAGGSARVLQFDIGARAETAAALPADIEAHGCYYGVVCNAGVARDTAFPAMTGEEWDQVLGTNLDGFFNVLNPLVMPMVQRRKLEEQNGGQVRSGASDRVPPGYGEAVAEYFRKLSKGK